MQQQEFYVRAPDSENARGPYSLEKLISLADAAQVDRETLYYDDEQEAWKPIVDSDLLREAVFPERRKLTLRSQGSAETGAANRAESARPAVTVEQMLAAAEGDTEETRHLKERQRWEARTAATVLPLLTLTMLLSALSLIYPSWKVLEPVVRGREGSDWKVIFEQPLPLVGALDLLFALLMALAVTRAYPLLRARVMLGLGFFGFLGYAAWAAGRDGGLLLVASALLFSVGVLVATLTLRFALMVTAISCAILGILGYTVFTIFPELL